MANLLWVIEYDKLAVATDGKTVPAGREPALAKQRVDFTGVTGTGTELSSKFNANTRYVEVVCDTDCQVEFGKSGVVQTGNTSKPVFANDRLFVGIDPSNVNTLAYRILA